MPVRREYVLQNNAVEWWYQARRPDVQKGLKPSVYLRFENRDGQLGIPLPAGVVRAYMPDSGGGSQLIGEDSIAHTAKGELVSLRLGEAFDLTADRVQTDFRAVSEHSRQSSYRIELRNADSKPVTVTMADLLERYLGRRLPVFLDNDANLCLLAEVARGVARGREHVMFVKASVGIGLALFLDGKLYRGSTGAAGQFGHTPVAVHLGDGAAGAAAGTPPRCSTCGRVGCLEVFASARALVEQLRPLPSLTFGRDFTPADVVGMTIEEVDLALGGKRAEAQAAIREAGRQLGIAIGGLINVLDPQMVVIGGVLARAGDLILEPIRNEVRERAVRVRPEQVEVVESQLRERAEVHGGIALALAETSALRSLSVPQPPRPAR